MEYQKITNLLCSSIDEVPKFSNKNWAEVYDKSDMTHNTSKQIRFKRSMLRSDLCDYSHAYIIVKGKITVTGPNDNVYDNQK